MVLDIDYGSAGTANCVLVPPYNYKKGKYNNNYVSKIANYTEDKKIIDNEIRISNYLKQNISNNLIDKYFSIVINNHNLKKSKYKKLKKCNLKSNTDYKILYSKNVGCKPITKHSKIFIKNNNIHKIRVNNIKETKIISKKKIYNSKQIVRTCGDLIQELVQKKTFSEKMRVKSIKILIKSMKILHNNNLIHFDIKLDNIIYDNNKLRLIDFGGSILLHDFNNINLNNDFNVLIDEIYNKLFSWTTDYISPEILIILEFKKNPFINQDEMIYKIKKIIENSINERLNKKYYLELTQLIEYIYDNKLKFIKELFKNGYKSYIFKTDIYSMGISIYILLKYLNNDTKFTLKSHRFNKYKKIKMHKIMKLLYNMTIIDYRNRYNINDCIQYLSFI